MARFHKYQFETVIENLEKAECQGENIWLAVGILEYMYDDDWGYIDTYFHSKPNSRNRSLLWDKLQNQLIKKSYANE